MNKEQEKDVAALTAAGGVPARQIFPSEVDFELPDTGMKVSMRKMMVSDSAAVLKDKLADQENYVERMLVTLSLICTFDGKPIQWQDLQKKLPLVDYNYAVLQYMEMQEPGKKIASS